MAGIERVLLYVGAPKTGTTSVQAFLRDNRDALTKQGIYSPMAGRGGIGQHIELPTLVPTQRQRNGLDRHTGPRDDDIEARVSRFRGHLDSELAAATACHTLLFFSEYMFSSNIKEIRAYRDLFSSYAPKFESIMYLRRQDQWLASLTLQARKSGARKDLILNPGSPKHFAEGIRAWDSQSDRCHIRRLDPALMHGGKLLEDFCDVMGADTSGLTMEEVRANPAVLQEQVQLMDALNKKIELMRFQFQILYRSRFIGLCADTLGGTRIAFQRDAAIKAFDSFRNINRWLRDTRDPGGPEFYFNTDFSAYEDEPDNGRRYTRDELLRLISVISGLLEERGLAPPPAPDASSQEELVDHVISAFMSLRGSEMHERRQVRLAARAAEQQNAIG
jgi:hypothetical protein